MWYSRLKYINEKRNINEIKTGWECCFDVKTTCQPAPFTVVDKVPDVACNLVLKMSSGLLEGG